MFLRLRNIGNSEKPRTHDELEQNTSNYKIMPHETTKNVYISTYKNIHIDIYTHIFISSLYPRVGTQTKQPLKNDMNIKVLEGQKQ